MFVSTPRPRVPTEERELLPLSHRQAGGSSSLNRNLSPPRRPLSPPQPHPQPAGGPPRRPATAAATIHIPPPKRRETTSVHDAALAELSSRLYGRRGATTRSTTTNTPGPAKSSILFTGPFPHDDEIFDPFTGAPAGVLKAVGTGAVKADPSPLRVGHESPTPGEVERRHLDGSSSGSGSQSGSQPESPSSVHSSDTWAALAKIRTLQSDVARTHLQSLLSDQERPGSKSPSRRGSVGSSRERAAKGGGQANKQDVSEKSVADAFAGRREAIDEIVKKLEDLSSAVKHLHALPTPSFTFLDATPLPSPRDDANSNSKRLSMPIPARAHTAPTAAFGSPTSSISSSYPITSGFSSPLLPMAPSPTPRYSNYTYSPPPSGRPRSQQMPPSQQPQRTYTSPPATSTPHFSFPARASSPRSHSPMSSVSRNTSGIGSKGGLPPIWDSPEEVSSPRSPTGRGGGGSGGWGHMGGMSTSPRSTAQMSLG